MHSKSISIVLVFFQLAAIFGILITAPVYCNNPFLLVIEISGVLLTIVSVKTIKRGNFNITPIPKHNGMLCTTGIYRIIRHPMYLANLIILLPLVINYYNVFRLIIFLILVVNLIIKLHIEEKMLIVKFQEYQSFKEKSWRLIPFIY